MRYAGGLQKSKIKRGIRNKHKPVRSFLHLSLLAVLFLSACIPGSAGMLDALPMQSFPADGIFTIQVNIDAGTLNIKQNQEALVRFSGMAPVGQKSIPIQNRNDGVLLIQIQPENSAESVYLLEIPDGKKLVVTSNSANINLTGYQGEASVDSTSGSINAKNLTGLATLRSGRGTIDIRDSSGEMHVLGEHGVLTLQNLHGLVTSSTIMGTIRYTGSPIKADQINLEVDHGPISIDLGQASSVKFTVQSASGEVQCLVPQVEQLSRGCTGIFGAGEAQLHVRSVSGKINLTVRQ
jgi:hypothetical protein